MGIDGAFEQLRVRLPPLPFGVTAPADKDKGPSGQTAMPDDAFRRIQTAEWLLIPIFEEHHCGR